MANKDELKVWLDQQVALRELACSLKKYDEDIDVIDFCNNKRIHCFGINKIASRLGFTVYHKKSSENTMERYFEYKGYKFFQLVDENEGSDL